jgi:hypothetical protein
MLATLGLTSRLEMSPIARQTIAAAAMLFLSVVASAQSATVAVCAIAPPLVISSLGAVVSGNTINVTLVGFTFSVAPFHRRGIQQPYLRRPRANSVRI